MIPLKDNIPTERFPIVTVVLIAINVAFMVWQWTFPTDPALDAIGFGEVDQSSLEYGAMPYRITEPTSEDCAIGAVGVPSGGLYDPGVVCPGTPEFERAVEIGRQNPGSGLEPVPVEQAAWFVTLFTSMFMHGGILHIVGNMLFLWVFGDNVEDLLGHRRYLLFYLAAGAFACLVQGALSPESVVPVLGASGAVAGVLGAYLLWFPRATVRVVIPFFILIFIPIPVPAWLMIGLWFAQNLLSGYATIASAASPATGVAWFAHIGGFLFGMLVAAGRRQRAR